ncbi:MAG TPA: hypothetical protein VJ850_07250 [Candidatus Limnocylindrales bacterium]|nr:hypothetical protein [Candidatus Limnocylindrales bacterium]
MRTPHRFVGRRVLGSALTATLASTLLIGVGAVAAAPPSKATVCHLGTTGTISPITIPAKAAAAHVAAGDYAADLTLVGKTVYAKAWTNIDGIAGYSICDKLIGAYYESSGDSHLSAGDTLIVGSYPTAFEPPYNFGSAAITRTIVGVTTCTSTDSMVDLGDGAYADLTAFAIGEAFDYSTAAADVVLVQDAFNDILVDLIAVYGGVSLIRFDAINSPFLDVELSTGCAG